MGVEEYSEAVLKEERKRKDQRKATEANVWKQREGALTLITQSLLSQERAINALCRTPQWDIKKKKLSSSAITMRARCGLAKTPTAALHASPFKLILL